MKKLEAKSGQSSAAGKATDGRCREGCRRQSRNRKKKLEAKSWDRALQRER